MIYRNLKFYVSYIIIMNCTIHDIISDFSKIIIYFNCFTVFTEIKKMLLNF